MTLNITTAETPIKVDTISTLIYAPPGNGKTSLAFSAASPLCLDFDHGAHRSAFRRDAVRVENWTEVANLTAADLKDYDTIVIDTVGRALDMLTLHIQNQNPKTRTSTGGLTLQGWGDLKSSFAHWMKGLRLMGKDIVMIAHDKEDKRGDDTVLRADIQGGSYSEVFKLADGVGYLSIDAAGLRRIDFTPSAFHSGKNPADLPVLEVPDLNQQPDFYAEVTARIKESLGEISAESQAIAKEVAKLRKKITKCDDAESMNKMLDKVNAIESKTIKAQAKRLMLDQCEKAGVTFDKKAGEFVKAKAAA